MAWVERHIACEDCGSSDGRSIDDNGWSKCFACDTNKKVDGDYEPPRRTHKVSDFSSTLGTLITGKTADLSSRCIAPTAAKKFGVVGEGHDVVFPYYDPENPNQPIAAKRRMQGKRFVAEGDISQAGLFGQTVFPAGGRSITVVEGEYDALAVYQMNGGYPVVSIRNGAQSALKDCQSAYEYLDSFERVVIFFDNDDPGRKAAGAVADLFGAKAALFPHADGLKDANDYLAKGKTKTFTSAWWAAKPYTPEGIVSAADLLEAIKVPLKRSQLKYPFEKLDNMMYGIREAELVTLCAGSGLGKSTILREIAVAMMGYGNSPIGLMFLEETPERTLRGLIGLEMNKPIHLPDVEYDPQEVVDVYESKQYDKRVFLWDSFGSNEMERVLARMRYFVKVLGCQFIILDHLSILVSDQHNGDERKAIDMIMTKLRVFAQEMRITLLLVSHLTRPPGKSLEDGAVTSLGMLRGSGAIAQLSDAVIGAERNSQAEDPVERNTTKLRVLKNRFSGKTGPAGNLFYDEETGRLSEVDLEEAL